MEKINRFKSIRYIYLIIILASTNAFSQQGLKAEYYDGTDFNRLDTIMYVPNIDQAWFNTPPVPGIDPHECSIRWTGKLKPGKSGTYTFSAQVDDGIRVWIDDKQIMDQWELNDVGRFEGTINLEANHEYNLKVEYFNGLFEGEVRLLWKKHKEDLSWYERMFGDGIPFSVIPPENFLLPKMLSEIIEQPIEKPKKRVHPKVIKKKPIATQVKKKTAIKKPKNTTKPKPKEVLRPEPPTPKFSAKAVEKFLPKNVQFEKGKTNIVKSSFEELNAFIDFMLKYPELNVMIEGHTDVIGDAALNLELSKDRANVIGEYLVDKGVDRKRIKSEGFGGSRPLVVSGKGKYQPENRRVVFVIEGL